MAQPGGIRIRMIGTRQASQMYTLLRTTVKATALGTLDADNSFALIYAWQQDTGNLRNGVPFLVLCSE